MLQDGSDRKHPVGLDSRHLERARLRGGKPGVAWKKESPQRRRENRRERVSRRHFMASADLVISVLGHRPSSIGGMEVFARELSTQLACCGWKSLFLFSGSPSDAVECFLATPDCRLGSVEGCGTLVFRPIRRIKTLLADLRPRIVHFHLLGRPRTYPGWRKRVRSKGSSSPTTCPARSDTTPTGQACRRRTASRVLSLPITKVFCVSSYVYRCWAEAGTLNA